jgi:hypothetical protein
LVECAADGRGQEIAGHRAAADDHEHPHQAWRQTTAQHVSCGEREPEGAVGSRPHLLAKEARHLLRPDFDVV